MDACGFTPLFTHLPDIGVEMLRALLMAGMPVAASAGPQSSDPYCRARVENVRRWWAGCPRDGRCRGMAAIFEEFGMDPASALAVDGRDAAAHSCRSDDLGGGRRRDQDDDCARCPFGRARRERIHAVACGRDVASRTACRRRRSPRPCRGGAGRAEWRCRDRCHRRGRHGKDPRRVRRPLGGGILRRGQRGRCRVLPPHCRREPTNSQHR